MTRQKKPHKKWNRVHQMKWHKKTQTRKGHPSYVFGSSGKRYRFFCFTHSESTDGKENIRLKYNIAPDETEDCYVRPIPQVDSHDNFEPPKKLYRIHEEDMSLIRSLRKKK